MSFFEPPPPREEPPQPPQPPWLGPPANEIGVGVPGGYVLARTDTIALAVVNVVAFSTGFSFLLSGRARPGTPLTAARRALFDDMFHGSESEGRLRFGVQFADGRKATDLHWPADDGLAEGERPVLIGRGGGSGPDHFDLGQWVWPLPPAGPLAFVCQWPDRGIALTRIEVDAGPIVAAAATSEPLWPERGADRGGWTGFGSLGA